MHFYKYSQNIVKRILQILLWRRRLRTDRGYRQLLTVRVTTLPLKKEKKSCPRWGFLFKRLWLVRYVNSARHKYRIKHVAHTFIPLRVHTKVKVCPTRVCNPLKDSRLFLTVRWYTICRWCFGGGWPQVLLDTTHTRCCVGCSCAKSGPLSWSPIVNELVPGGNKNKNVQGRATLTSTPKISPSSKAF